MTERLSELFEEQAALSPDAICVISGNKRYTYKEIEESANQIAHWLIKKGIKNNDIIAILVDNPVDFYQIMLGVLKAGAGYLALDPRFPDKRIEYILQDAKAKLLITTKNSFRTTLIASDNIIPFEKTKANLSIEPGSKPILAPGNKDDLCYVIYTSGTTGNPKGIAISQGAVINYVKVALQLYGVNKQDRIYQGFKVAFDAALEEIWMAFASGATLVASASREVREGAALIEFLNFHQITFFSTVPTLLAMLTPDIPTLRILILGGEVCTKTLISPWMREDLRIFNTYGPSEATIIATCLECKPESEITLGKPLNNYDVAILDEQLQPVPQGAVGELCISGVGLALGYINNPEMTAQKFVYPAFSGQRFYRSGDLAFINEKGEIEYKGRMDEQVKLRGYRIEIAEIETRICQDKAVANAAVTVHESSSGMKFLVAYIIPREVGVLDVEKLKKSLQSALPFFMIPSLFEMVEDFPRLPSGKLDKKSLPKPQLSNTLNDQDYVPAATDMEKKIAAIWEAVLNISPISVEAHFFKHLGGHSLAAAKIVSAMRSEESMRGVSMVDIFENATIRQLARVMEKSQESAATENTQTTDHATLSFSLYEKMQRTICYTLQGLVSLFLIVLPSWYFCIILLLAITMSLVTTGLPLMSVVPYWIAFIVLLEPALILFSIITKWLLLGRIKPGKYKLWGWFYLRWWVVKQIQDLAPVEHLIGSPFIIYYYRMMGAKIGKYCYIGTDQLDSFDLISMGDNSSLCSDVIASGYKVENGWLKIGTIRIGNNCFIGTNSVLSLNTILKNGAKLGEQSMLSEGSIIPENDTFSGSPGKPGNIELDMSSEVVPKKLSAAYLFCNFGLLLLMELVYIIAMIPGLALIVNYSNLVIYSAWNLMWVIPVASLSLIFLLLLQISLLKKIAKPIKKGAYPLHSFAYLKIWFVDRLLALGLKTMEPLYGTIYSASWFRLLGADIGKNSELSTVNFTFPEMLHIGQDSFIADSSILGPARIYKGCYFISPVYLGNRVFIGNSALIPANTVIGDNCLIGCATLPPKKTPSHTNWIGTPALFLPQRERHASFKEQETYAPLLSSKIGRGIVELFRIFLPSIFLLCILTLDIITLTYLRRILGFSYSLLLFPFFSIVYTLLVVNIVICLKWLLIGTYKKTEVAMWKPFVWYSELITSLYDSVVVVYLLEALTGTPFISHFLRNLGVKIGKNVFINTPYFSEFDLVTINDRVSLNRESIIQTHLYEDRIFKMSSITLESDVSVGDRSILLYGTLMKTHSTLDSLSLLMKGEILYPQSHWEGIPAKRIYCSQFKD